MKLEVGKYYRTRDGRKVGPVGYNRNRSHSKWPFTVPQSFVTYCQNGTHLVGANESRNDLIAEWTDTPEVGTLKEIGARAGDVVEWVSSDKLHYGNHHVGKSHTIQSDGRVLLDGGDGKYWGFLEDADGYLNVKWRIISRAQPSPVRTVTTTRLEIVTGTYGKVQVQDVAERIGIVIDDYFDADELTDAIATLTTIRDAMKANTTA